MSPMYLYVLLARPWLRFHQLTLSVQDDVEVLIAERGLYEYADVLRKGAILARNGPGEHMQALLETFELADNR